MPQQRLNLMELPASIRGPVDKLMHSLLSAHSRADIEREGAIELGFVLGLETARCLRASDIEALYLIFDDAVQAQLQALPDA
jgi:hypothetical protein